MAIHHGLFILAAVLLTSQALAQQSGMPACASKLVPCANYLNSTKPPASCCDPLREAVKTEQPCLCSLFNSPALMKAFQINVTQALELPKHCGIAQDPNVCSKTGATTPPASKSPPATGTTPPGTGSGSSSKDSSAGTFVKGDWIKIVCLVFSAWSLVAI